MVCRFRILIDKCIENAGIDMDEVAAEMADLIRRERMYGFFMTDLLSDSERDILRSGGALGVTPSSTSDDQVRNNILSLAGEYTKMVEQAYDLDQVAEILCSSPNNIREYTAVGRLYTVAGYQGRVFPHWQFYDNKTLPGLQQVLKVISHDAHPLAIMNFFLNISPDLESPIDGTLLNPRDWLIAGYQVDEVVIIASEL